MADLDRFFSDVRALVDGELDELIPSPATEPARLYEAIRWSVFGEGKRFRPALVFASGREFGSSDARLLRTAAAVEMIHTYSLIHDDLPAMDNDDLRRGRATAHKKFDEATAILAGDALQAMAFETIAEDELLDVELRLRLIAELSAAAGQMVAGQQLDLEAEGKALSLSDIERIHLGKTGALIRFAVRAGGLIAAVNTEEFDILTAFGEKLGLLFQITDDILDVTSTSEELGKTAGKDIASQKATYPEVLGLEMSTELVKQVETDALAILAGVNRADALLGDVCRYVSKITCCPNPQLT
jgi:geranylgeranyl pyrophosphate synthase